MTMTKPQAVFALSLIVLCLLVLSFLSKAHSAAACQPLVPLDQAKVLVNNLDIEAGTLSSTTKQIYNESSEGGIQTSYKETDGTVRIVEQRLFGAIGRTFMRFYFDHNRLFALVKLDEQYQAPINVDPSVVISTSTEEDYYFSSDKRVCTLFLNGKSQPLATTTQEMIESFISQIQR
jgi:hypothetical protein